MESWGYVSQGKGDWSDNTISTPSTLARIKTPFSGWELKTSPSHGNYMLFPTQQNLQNQGFGELSFPGMVGKQLPKNDPLSGALNNKLGDAHGGRVISSATAAPNAFSNGTDSSSKRSNSVVESNGRDSLIDLKLGRFLDQRDGKDVQFSEVAPAPILSSSSSSTPPKRARASGGHSQAAFCQVYGCNKDLSGSKDYHKRHKVCELHSKTAKVIVNGIEQRFCQQCSRFHLLAEFDDGKRSCRKRLAGHNERRRKPQVGVHTGRPGRLVQSYTDNSFHGTSLTTSSFICQDLLPNRLLHAEKVATYDWFRPIKTEDGANYGNLSAIPVSNGQQHSRSSLPSFNSEKVLSFLQENDASTSAGNIFNASNCEYAASFEVPNSGSRTLLLNTSLGSDDFNVFDTTSNIHGLSGILDSGRALSLLSSQSQNSSDHSSGIPMRGSFFMPSSLSQYGMSQVSERVTGISSQTSASGVINKFPSTGMNLADGHLGVVLISDCSDVNFDISDGILQETDFVNAKDHLSCKDGATIDLLQLSSQLQRVEHHRQTVHVKQDNLQTKDQ